MDSFQRVKVIGRGAFGAAVLVKRAGALFVMKEVQLGGMSAKEQLEAQHEAKVLRELDHPYIVHYVDSGISRGKLWIAMEYASGGDLDAYIQAKKRANKLFAVQEALGIFAQVCSALQYLHDKKILHRDLKTKNIFLDKPSVSDAIPVVKLGDFGISKVLAHTRALAKTQIGTPYYLSPEICEDKPYSFKSDVWAMGVVLFEMLALRVPFEAKDMASLVEKILKSPAPKLPSTFERVEGLSALYSSMLDKTAGRRPMIQEILALPLIKNALEFVQAQQLKNGSLPEPPPRERAASAASRPPGSAAHPALQHHFQPAAPQPPAPQAPSQAQAQAQGVVKSQAQAPAAQRQQHAQQPRASAANAAAPPPQRVIPKMPARVKNPPESQHHRAAEGVPLRRESHDVHSAPARRPPIAPDEEKARMKQEAAKRMQEWRDKMRAQQLEAQQQQQQVYMQRQQSHQQPQGEEESGDAQWMGGHGEPPQPSKPSYPHQASYEDQGQHQYGHQRDDALHDEMEMPSGDEPSAAAYFDSNEDVEPMDLGQTQQHQHEERQVSGGEYSPTPPSALSASKKFSRTQQMKAAARQAYMERREVAQRNAKKILEQLGQYDPSVAQAPPSDAAGGAGGGGSGTNIGGGGLSKAEEVKARKQAEKDRARRLHEQQLAEAHRQRHNDYRPIPQREEVGSRARPPPQFSLEETRVIEISRPTSQQRSAHGSHPSSARNPHRLPEINNYDDQLHELSMQRRQLKEKQVHDVELLRQYEMELQLQQQQQQQQHPYGRHGPPSAHQRQQQQQQQQYQQQYQQQQQQDPYQDAVRNAYMERQRLAQENARRVNEQLGRHVPGSAASSHHGGGGGDDAPSESATQRVRRIKAEKEARKEEERLEKERMLAEARRQAALDRQALASRIQQGQNGPSQNQPQMQAKPPSQGRAQSARSSGPPPPPPPRSPYGGGDGVVPMSVESSMVDDGPVDYVDLGGHLGGWNHRDRAERYQHHPHEDMPSAMEIYKSQLEIAEREQVGAAERVLAARQARKEEERRQHEEKLAEARRQMAQDRAKIAMKHQNP